MLAILSFRPCLNRRGRKVLDEHRTRARSAIVHCCKVERIRRLPISNRRVPSLLSNKSSPSIRICLEWVQFNNLQNIKCKVQYRKCAYLFVFSDGLHIVRVVPWFPSVWSDDKGSGWGWIHLSDGDPTRFSCFLPHWSRSSGCSQDWQWQDTRSCYSRMFYPFLKQIIHFY